MEKSEFADACNQSTQGFMGKNIKCLLKNLLNS